MSWRLVYIWISSNIPQNVNSSS